MEGGDSKEEENSKKKCSCKIQILLFVILAIIFSDQIKTVYFFIYNAFVPHQPYRKIVHLDRKANLIDDNFSIDRDCSYGINLYLLHKNKGLDEYRDKLSVDGALPYKPLPSIVDIQIISTKKYFKKPFIHWTKEPAFNGRTTSATKYKLGSVYLIEGDYQLQLKVLNASAILQGIDVEVVLQGSDLKSVCGKPIRLLTMQKP